MVGYSSSIETKRAIILIWERENDGGWSHNNTWANR